MKDMFLPILFYFAQILLEICNKLVTEGGGAKLLFPITRRFLSWPYVDLFRGRLIAAHRSDLRSAIGQLARLVGYEPTSEKINIRP